MKILAEVLRRLSAIEGRGAVPRVRLAWNDPIQAKAVMDSGAAGVIVPMVNTRAEAEACVASVKYHPDGVRSNAGMRGEWGDFDQGSSAGYREYMDFFNENVLICPMIETTAAVANIDAIASVPGGDVCLIGPSDLSITHDVPLDYTSDKYIETLKTISAACAKGNSAACSLTVTAATGSCIS